MRYVQKCPKLKPSSSSSDLLLTHVFLSPVKAHPSSKLPTLKTERQLCPFLFLLLLSLHTPAPCLPWTANPLESCLFYLQCTLWIRIDSEHPGAGPQHPCQCLAIVSCMNRTFLCRKDCEKFIPGLRRVFMIRPVDTEMLFRASREGGSTAVAIATMTTTTKAPKTAP